jgi:putative DNA primase/helicase
MGADRDYWRGTAGGAGMSLDPRKLAVDTDPLRDEILAKVDQCIATMDPAIIWAMVDQLAILSGSDFGAIRARLCMAFGAETIGIEHLEKSVKEYKAELRKAEKRERARAGNVLEFGDWHTRLLRSDQGKLLPCFDNLALMLENSPEWAGVLGYDSFRDAFIILRTPPAPITAAIGEELQDHFDVETTRWAERQALLVKPGLVRSVVDTVARRKSFHPVRDYLNGLQWDGVPRIGTMLIDYFGATSSDQNPNHFAMAAGQKFMISAVARVLDPGCKVDHVPVLEGRQGIGKSTAVNILAGEWFTDHLSEMGSKDASMQVRGVWIVELGELAALSRGEVERQKQFISQQTERFRLPYGRRLVQVPRQCVFVGTTNADTWLRDETGGRRFWPVRCGAIDLEGLRRDRDQLWAEAVHLYRDGATWWLDDADLVKDAIEEQSDRYADDVWQASVESHAEAIAEHHEGLSGGKVDARGRGSASLTEILARLGVETGRQDQTAANRVARCLKVAGWERFKWGPRNNREWRYRPACPTQHSKPGLTCPTLPCPTQSGVPVGVPVCVPD